MSGGDVVSERWVRLSRLCFIGQVEIGGQEVKLVYNAPQEKTQEVRSRMSHATCWSDDKRDTRFTKAYGLQEKTHEVRRACHMVEL